MQEVVYHTNYKFEDSYWWFTARSEVVRNIIKKVCKFENTPIVLDVGCGTGGFARDMMKDGFKVIGLDTSETALEYAKMRGVEVLYQMTLDKFDAKDKNIDAITILDVIEHIEDDKAVINDISNTLNSGKWLIATVPAYQWLWSRHDEIHMHYRRYKLNDFQNLIKNAGFEIYFASYYNSFLFLPAVMKRFLDKITGAEKKHTEPVEVVSDRMNKLFDKIFKFEKKFLPSFRFPFGLSIILVAKKK